MALKCRGVAICRHCLLVSCAVSILLGGAVMSIVIMMWTNKVIYLPTELLSHIPELSPTLTGMVGLAIILLLVSGFGCLAAISNQPWMFILYSSLVVVLLTGETICASIVFYLVHKANRWTTERVICEDCLHDDFGKPLTLSSCAAGCMAVLPIFQVMSLFCCGKLVQHIKDHVYKHRPWTAEVNNLGYHDSLATPGYPSVLMEMLAQATVDAHVTGSGTSARALHQRMDNRSSKGTQTTLISPLILTPVSRPTLMPDDDNPSNPRRFRGKGPTLATIQQEASDLSLDKLDCTAESRTQHEDTIDTGTGMLHY